MALKGLNVDFAHVGRMGFTAMEFDESQYPVAVGLFGAIRIMMITQDLAGLVRQF